MPLLMNYDAMTYLLFVFGGCLGIYQIGAIAASFKGLWFFKKPLLTLIGGLVILVSTYIWFFTCANLDMNANDAAVVEGHEQLVFFLLGAFLALLLTFIISSLVNYRGVMPEDEPVIGEGLEDLKTMTVCQAFAYRRRNRSKGR